MSESELLVDKLVLNEVTRMVSPSGIGERIPENFLGRYYICSNIILGDFFSLKALCLDGCCCSLGIGLRARSFLVLTCAKNERSKDASTLAWALLVLIADLAIALFDQFGRRAEVLEVIVE